MEETMPQKYEKQIQQFEKKITLHHRIAIVGVIISIIGFCGMLAIIVQINQIQRELDEGGQNISEINQKLENSRTLMFFVFGPLMMFGPLISITGYNSKKRFSKLKQSYIDESDTKTELSLIID